MQNLHMQVNNTSNLLISLHGFAVMNINVFKPLVDSIAVLHHRLKTMCNISCIYWKKSITVYDYYKHCLQTDFAEIKHYYQNRSFIILWWLY